MNQYTPTVRWMLLGLLLIFINQFLAAPSRPTCPKNMQRGCRKMCRENCDSLNVTDPETCSESCILECVCKHGYIYKSHTSLECVPYAVCSVTCPQNMRYDPCTEEIPATCENPEGMSVLHQDCSPWCVCDEGYIYHSYANRTCVLKTGCTVLDGVAASSSMLQIMWWFLSTFCNAWTT